ncbi:MAG: glutamate-5-semialdehyde dehydrogenase, partial [Lachnospiraceae bacterium]|nr:glutamate-5-semialdehyde dehydrogenase [Lachnospiraceae bacterium]
MSDLIKLGQNAQKAKYALAKCTSSQIDKALVNIAQALMDNSKSIIEKNAIDLDNGVKKGMHAGLLDRLKLDEKRIGQMAQGLKEIAELKTPVGEVIETWERPNGLNFRKTRVPIGVIGIIYESRPNVTADAFGLCFKTQNAVILKGGSDAINSNKVICDIIREALSKENIDPNAVSLIESTDREVTKEFMHMNKFVDVLIPRGGAGLIQSVVKESSIPVIETGTGNCHIYVDETADIDMAVKIIDNAKTQRIGVCNACESLVIHRKALEPLMEKLKVLFKEKHVELRGDEAVVNADSDAIKATEEDFGKEYLDYIISGKTVDDIDEAIEHINRYNTGHSECIVTRDMKNAEKFLNEVDAACVYVNASTRFSDGGEFGFGAEIGISTQKLHARGPMG